MFDLGEAAVYRRNQACRGTRITRSLPLTAHQPRQPQAPQRYGRRRVKYFRSRSTPRVRERCACCFPQTGQRKNPYIPDPTVRPLV